ncbi:uncharacterized protein B0H18DRAFT_1123677 [Fomitopsis serialis]|uniref:uncharacterized protein n=1 Tax=Fomitopsis serialis TaxID=139415 RepID=UPI002007521E|nr:uncharacterized protein B0H18DRAFT_1123677 [Neoantrodia serialis]KAH9917337.1 hypothetical protein B0H18DRAFT_1123677 [Neoantrodia serialis]
MKFTSAFLFSAAALFYAAYAAPTGVTDGLSRRTGGEAYTTPPDDLEKRVGGEVYTSPPDDLEKRVGGEVYTSPPDGEISSNMQNICV